MSRCKGGVRCQLYVSKTLADHLGPFVLVLRDGAKFMLVRAEEAERHARSITGAHNSNNRRFSCRELFDALDEGRVYVEPRGEGRFEL